MMFEVMLDKISMDGEQKWRLSGGSHAWCPPAFQILLSYQILSQYLLALRSSGSDTIETADPQRTTRGDLVQMFSHFK
jgi:hypothetical protein